MGLNLEKWWGNVTPIDGANLNPIEDTVSLNLDTLAVIKIHGAREFQHKWEYIFIYVLRFSTI